MAISSRFNRLRSNNAFELDRELIPRDVMMERCTSVNHPGWVELRRQLWPQCCEAEHLAEMTATCSNPSRLSAFLAKDEAGRPVGLVEAALRTDYVNGTNSSPVGFIEGIYVIPGARQKGVARALVQAVEAWARTNGCREMASDARIENETSHAMHRALGFVETMRVVYFRKELAVVRSHRGTANQVTIGEFQADHARELIPMWRESFELGVGIEDPHPIAEQEKYFWTVVIPNNAIRVAFLEGQMVGFVAASATSISQLYVRKGFHRRGIGSLLVEWSKNQSGGSLWLFTFERNVGARAFYQRHGFRIVARGFEPMWKLNDLKYEWSSKCSAVEDHL